MSSESFSDAAASTFRNTMKPPVAKFEVPTLRNAKDGAASVFFIRGSVGQAPGTDGRRPNPVKSPFAPNFPYLLDSIAEIKFEIVS
jgi:hypothetical protein